MQFRLSSDINACGRLKHVKMRFADVGQNHPTARLYVETLPRTAWVDPSVSVDTSAIKNLVDVHRLPEVSSLYGLTRFEAAPTSSDGDIEDIQLAVHGTPISRAADRLLAIEQIGEGLHIDEQVVTRRLQTSDVVNRQASLLRGYVHWRTRSTASRLWGQAPDGPSNGV